MSATIIKAECTVSFLFCFLFGRLQTVSGFVALRAMVRHTERRFHLSQFNGIQELRT